MRLQYQVRLKELAPCFSLHSTFQAPGLASLSAMSSSYSQKLRAHRRVLEPLSHAATPLCQSIKHPCRFAIHASAGSSPSALMWPFVLSLLAGLGLSFARLAVWISLSNCTCGVDLVVSPPFERESTDEVVSQVSQTSLGHRRSRIDPLRPFQSSMSSPSTSSIVLIHTTPLAAACVAELQGVASRDWRSSASHQNGTRHNFKKHVHVHALPFQLLAAHFSNAATYSPETIGDVNVRLARWRRGNHEHETSVLEAVSPSRCFSV